MDAGKLLLTGATGFIGGAIAAELIAAPEWRRVLLLVRASSAEEGVRRIQETLARFSVPARLRKRVVQSQVICGDLIDVARFADDRRLGEVRDVVNCAAFASFSKHPQIPVVNIDGTLAFARAVQSAAKLRRFIQVGTAMSCGVQAPTPVAEAYDPGDEGTHLVPYTWSKLEGERRLASELPGLPLVVVRPSIVVGHTRLGCAPSPSIFWVFRVARALRRFQCSLDSRIDIVPVDYCAQSILALLRKPRLRYTKYHLSAGAEGSCNFRQIDEAIGAGLGEGPTHDYEQASYEEIERLQDRFESLLGRCIRPLVLQAIRLYGQFSALDMVFESNRILEEGLPPPPRFADYAGLCAVTARDGSIAEQMQYDFKGLFTRRSPSPAAARAIVQPSLTPAGA
jgi:nucleoside-diphosphate-sugar epimerase